MKKTKQTVAMIAAALLAATSLAACSGGGKKVNENDIVFSVFNGGYGYAYAQNVANAWNEANKDTGFTVTINPNKDEWYSIAAALEAGTAISDIYETSITSVDEAVAKNWVEDLTDVYNATADGDTKTLRQKFKASEEGNVPLYMVGDKYYGIPVSTDICGFVYDHDIFLEKGFLIAEAKTANGGAKLISSPTDALSVGRDGVSGTLDDGQPVNMDEYNLMIDAIKGSTMYSYISSGKFGYYLDPLFDSLMIEYEGYDAWMDMLDYEFTYEGKTVTKETGYEIYAIDGRLKALEFFDTYICDPTLYHPQSVKQTSHTDVQKTFVYGNAFGGATADKQTAFIYEGVWWENEARANFNSLKSRGYNDYEYGKRNYRMMMLPKIDENQKNDEVVFSSFGSLNLVVKKQSNPEKLAAIKSFLTLFYSDYWLQETTVTAGMLVPYDCGLNKTTLARASQFTRNMHELVSYDNVRVYRKEWNSKLYTGMYNSYIGNSSKGFLSMRRGDGLTTSGSAQTLFDETITYYRNNWSSVLEDNS